MNCRIIVRALAYFSFAAMSVPASAAVVLVTVNGTITSGADNTNYFGLGTDFSAVGLGPAYFAQFEIDVDRFNAAKVVSAGTAQGSGENTSNPIVKTSFTINGRTISWTDQSQFIGGNTDGFVRKQNGSVDLFEVASQNVAFYGNDFDGYNSDRDYADLSILRVGNIFDDIDVATPFTYNFGQGSDVRRQSQFYTARYDQGLGQYSRLAGGGFDVMSVSVSPFNAVPEPESWALLIVGFVAIGAALRLRSRRSPTGGAHQTSRPGFH